MICQLVLRAPAAHRQTAAAAARRTLASVAATRLSVPAHNHYRVVVVGAGTAGLAVAHQLGEVLKGDKLAIVDPSPVHYNQPLWTFVGAGIKPFADSVRPTAHLIPSSFQWLPHAVARIDPTNQHVHLADRGTLSYDYLVVAPGLTLRWDKISGLAEAIADPAESGVVSNYHADAVQSTWPAIQALKKGTALFTMPSTPIKCAGAPQKIAYLAEEHWRQNGGHVAVTYLAGGPKLFAIDKYAAALTDVCKARGIETRLGHELVAVDASNRTATFRHAADDEDVKLQYDLLHVTPQMAAPAFLADSQLTDAAGTARSRRYLRSATRRRCPRPRRAPVAVANILAHMSGKALPARYDGYTSCPLVTGRKSLILAEFSGFTAQPMETFPVDQAVERASMFHLTAHVLPEVYWHGLVDRGWWKGPKPVREWFAKWTTAGDKVEKVAA
ncbi:hypothetical protein AMAG_05923 [Allomyces macrogynus ATCC 38327]|uniref:Sulfide:quinone oxidoreductase, mitochondrial n=1 Tax=Allomyces macrogynus (strain ATCC 38327) TaxID=578462 RepID=A0A0L0SDC7_ALLM3|nr:hypothetical protein AMAG_05923 [Allomyces macrogynus ATCC 38327]|eukprot:KNE60543.1 hypothetical protein AMAG_05923 [Allomyces macrogynus ATCC 38327]